MFPKRIRLANSILEDEQVDVDSKLSHELTLESNNIPFSCTSPYEFNSETECDTMWSEESSRIGDETFSMESTKSEQFNQDDESSLEIQFVESRCNDETIFITETELNENQVDQTSQAEPSSSEIMILNGNVEDSGSGLVRVFDSRPSEENGIRFDIITPELLLAVTNCLRRLAQAQTLGMGASILGNLIGLGTLYTNQELIYIRDQTRNILRDEGFANFEIANIIGFVREWIDITPSALFPYNKKTYKSIKYKDLISVGCDICSICFDKFAKNSMCISMDCLHIFHSRCLNRWLNISQRCPSCRATPK